MKFGRFDSFRERYRFWVVQVVHLVCLIISIGTFCCFNPDWYAPLLFGPWCDPE